MSPLLKYAAGLAMSLTLCSALAVIGAAPPADAKEYNKARGIPSDSQALVNRIQAEMSGQNGEGQYGSRESDCGELDVGASTEANRPDNQVIVADKIINIDGQCRIVRNNGGFKQPDPATPNGAAKSPAKKQ